MISCQPEFKHKQRKRVKTLIIIAVSLMLDFISGMKRSIRYPLKIRGETGTSGTMETFQVHPVGTSMISDKNEHINIFGLKFLHGHL